MPEWEFRDYLRPARKNEEEIQVNEILLWTIGLPAKAQAKLDTIILLLRAWPPPWPLQYVSAYRGYPDIYELRVGSGGVQYRPLGCYGPESRTFTLLVGTVEKGGRIPRGALDTAVERRNRVLEGWPTCEHEFAKPTA
jgi:hypothetical protein